jgi:hypothetical protein
MRPVGHDLCSRVEPGQQVRKECVFDAVLMREVLPFGPVQPTSSPYRSSPRRVTTTGPEAEDSLGIALRVASVFVLAWALLRVAVSIVRGVDFEGCVAFLIVIMAVVSLARSLS